jgi:hypothetical protein
MDDLTDVLQDHRARNRANKPPDQEQLLAAANRQLQGVSNENEEDDDEEDDDEEEHEEETADGSIRAQRHSKSNGEAKPTTARYYPGAWRVAIIKAKTLFRRFVVLHNLFPLRDLHLQDAATILSKTIADLKSKATEDNPIVFDPGK